MAAPLFAQPDLHIDCGSATDQYFTGGTACQAGTACMPNPSVLPPTLRYGTFRYDIPVAEYGWYKIRLGFVDANKTAPGQRLFTVTANGQPSPKIDLFALFGNQPGALDTYVWAGWTQISLVFTPTVGNAIISYIEITELWGAKVLPITGTPQ